MENTHHIITASHNVGSAHRLPLRESKIPLHLMTIARKLLLRHNDDTLADMTTGINLLGKYDFMSAS